VAKRALPGVLVLTLLSCLFALPAAPGHADSPRTIFLRRAQFDPLRAPPAAMRAPESLGRAGLLLVQFDGPAGDARARLEQAGLRPLSYIPDDTWLVRDTGAGLNAARALPGVRWVGPYAPGLRRATELDGASAGADELRVNATPDADLDALAAAVVAAGGAVRARTAAGELRALRVTLPRAALPALIGRDDVLWVEPYHVLTVTNDRARRVLGIDQAREQLPGLTGAGQIVAVTDSGLDQQATLSADFAGRVARGFSRAEMSALCTSPDPSSSAFTWSDLNGHGTHVAGTIAGSGALSPPGQNFAGMAPQARLVVQATSSGGDSLDCLPDPDRYLGLAYDAGARVQNASFGSDAQGAYDYDASAVDRFLWEHNDHLLVVSAGNAGKDANGDGVIDRGSVGTPATAKNVISVGASENDRPRAAGGLCAFETPYNCAWGNFGYTTGALNTDPVSDNPDGLAPFSSRGPAQDGRIKPEIVAPGTSVLSTKSHDPNVTYTFNYDDDYAYNFGTSMAAPMVSGMAALVRQWLAQEKMDPSPSAALVKAMLLNGATDARPGQYGFGATAEIPAAWPNNVEGWGRANLPVTLGLDGVGRLWLADNRAGLATGDVASYPLVVAAGAPLRITLAWTDYWAGPMVAKALVNDLDLEVVLPNGSVVRGNAAAELPSACRSGGADRCNNVESVEIAAPEAGTYTVRVRGFNVPRGPQPFALVAHAAELAGGAPSTPAGLTATAAGGTGPAVQLNWPVVSDATFYEIEERTGGTVTLLLKTRQPPVTVVSDVGSHSYRVRACNLAGCSAWSSPAAAVVTRPPGKVYLPLGGG
jgi:subtilisin family serine protease